MEEKINRRYLMDCCTLEKKALLTGFRDFDINDKKLIESYTKTWDLDCSDLSFANLFIWGADGKMQFTISDDVLYIKLNFKSFPEFFWPPIPKRDRRLTTGSLYAEPLTIWRARETRLL